MSDNIFDADIEKNDDIIPVIYQPAVDFVEKFCAGSALRQEIR